jgi:hypothetical protein
MSPTKQFIAVSLIAGAMICAPAMAFPVVFDLSSTPEVNLNSYTKTVSGLTLEINNPQATNNIFPAAGGLNSAPTGFCAFLQVGTAGSRCYYGNLEIPTGNKFTGFDLSFNSDVTLQSLLISRLVAVNNPTITFTAGALTHTFNNFVDGDTLTFPTPFTVSANSIINVVTNGTGVSPVADGVFRINNLTVVPGPLGILGAASAFNFSRKLRRATRKKALN